jgi:hypothetical protein
MRRAGIGNRDIQEEAVMWRDDEGHVAAFHWLCPPGPLRRQKRWVEAVKSSVTVILDSFSKYRTVFIQPYGTRKITINLTTRYEANMGKVKLHLSLCLIKQAIERLDA